MQPPGRQSDWLISSLNLPIQVSAYDEIAVTGSVRDKLPVPKNCEKTMSELRNSAGPTCEDSPCQHRGKSTDQIVRPEKCIAGNGPPPPVPQIVKATEASRPSVEALRRLVGATVMASQQHEARLSPSRKRALKRQAARRAHEVWRGLDGHRQVRVMESDRELEKLAKAAVNDAFQNMLILTAEETDRSVVLFVITRQFRMHDDCELFLMIVAEFEQELEHKGVLHGRDLIRIRNRCAQRIVRQRKRVPKREFFSDYPTAEGSGPLDELIFREEAMCPSDHYVGF